MYNNCLRMNADWEIRHKQSTFESEIIDNLLMEYKKQKLALEEQEYELLRRLKRIRSSVPDLLTIDKAQPTPPKLDVDVNSKSTTENNLSKKRPETAPTQIYTPQESYCESVDNDIRLYSSKLEDIHLLITDVEEGLVSKFKNIWNREQVNNVTDVESCSSVSSSKSYDCEYHQQLQVLVQTVRNRKKHIAKLKQELENLQQVQSVHPEPAKNACSDTELRISDELDCVAIKLAQLNLLLMEDRPS